MKDRRKLTWNMRYLKQIVLLGLALFLYLDVSIGQGIVRSKKNRTSVLSSEIEYSLSEATKQFLFGNYGGSKYLFEKCLEADPDCAAACFMLGGFEAMSGNTQRAEEFASKAYTLEPDNRYYAENFVNLLLLNKKSEQALKVIRRMYESRPTLDLLIKTARLENQIGNHRKAIKLLRKGSKNLQREIAVEMVVIYKSREKHKIVGNLLGKLYSSYPEDEQIANEYALWAIKDGNSSLASGIFERDLINETANGILKENAVLFFLESGKPDLADSIARKVLRSIFEGENADLRPLQTWLDNPVLCKRYELEMLKLVNESEKSDPDSLKWTLLQSSIYERSGGEKDAIRLLKGIVSKGFEDPDVLKRLLYLMYESKDSDFLYLAAGSANRYSRDGSFQFLYGLALLKHNKYNELASLSQDVLNVEESPEMRAQFLSLLAEAYRKSGHIERSDSCFLEVLKLQPDNIMVLNNLSYYLAERNARLQLADQLSQRLIELVSNNATYLDTRGWVLYKQHKTGKAARILNLAVQMNKGSNPVMLEHLGDVYYYRGMKSEAMKYWNMAAARQSSIADIQGNQRRVETHKRMK